MERDFFYKRLTELRIKKGVSAREMSLALGQSESYINKIENQRTLPSLPGFFYICEYFSITPVEFFDASNQNPAQLQEIIKELKRLEDGQLDYLLKLLRDLKTGEKSGNW